MTDRELLELAAKAAGFNFRWFKVKQWKNMKGKIGPYRYCTGTVDVYGSHHTKPWSPLTDDGDALRLALKLGLTISVTGMFVHADCCNRDDDIGYFEENSARNDGCIFKASRRVIVRAASAIGEEMK